MAKINKVCRISLMGGLIGAITTNPRRALDNAIAEANADGWNCHQILPHHTTNLFMVFVQILCLCCTVGLWTFGAGYLLLMEKESNR
ncbi:MAG: hypothetical protein ROM54_07900 [Anaerobiospirillum sp.]|nr:hypothetical protein [Anaerobiospirillum sp.]